MLGCRLTEAEWEDFERFRKKHFPHVSVTVALRVLLQLALTVTGDATTLWADQGNLIPDGWFSNIMTALAKETASADEPRAIGQKKKGKKPAKKAAKVAVKEGIEE